VVVVTMWSVGRTVGPKGGGEDGRKEGLSTVEEIDDGQQLHTSTILY